MVQRAILVTVCVLLLAGCGADATESSEYRDLAADHDQAVKDLATAENTITELTQALNQARSLDQGSDLEPLALEQLPPAVATFKAAYESGDLQRVKDLFADDGIITTTDKVHGLYWGDDYWYGRWDKDGSEFARLGSIHQGEMMITRVIEMVGVVAFDWDWEDFASGTAVLHLRDDEIVVAMLTVSGDRIPAP